MGWPYSLQRFSSTRFWVGQLHCSYPESPVQATGVLPFHSPMTSTFHPQGPSHRDNWFPSFKDLSSLRVPPLFPQDPTQGFPLSEPPPPRTKWSFPVKNSLSHGPLWSFSPSQSLYPPKKYIIKWLRVPSPVKSITPQSPVISTSCGPKYHSSGPLTRINGITHSGTSLPQV